MVFIPMPSAQPNSRSIVAGSKVSACHISNSLLAVEGKKFPPTGHGCLAYQAFASVSVQRCCAPRVDNAVNRNASTSDPNSELEALREDGGKNCETDSFIFTSEMRRRILLRLVKIRCFRALRCGFVRASLAFVGDRELAMRLCKGGIGGQRLLVSGDGVSYLSAQHKLVASVECEVCALAADSTSG